MSRFENDEFFDDDAMAGNEENENVMSSTWEQGYARPWEDLEIDAAGGLKSTNLLEQRKKKAELPSTSAELVEKGVVRYLYIIFDCSVAMDDNDMRPSRRVAALDALQAFMLEFFSQNPISHAGIIVTHNGQAEKLTPLSGMFALDACLHLYCRPTLRSSVIDLILFFTYLCFDTR